MMKGFAHPMMIAIVIVAAVVVIGGYGGFIPASLIPAEFGFGGTTLSLDRAQFRSTSDWWTGDTWVLHISQGGMGQSWYGTITKEDIGKDSGEEPQNDFSMKISMPKQACRYELYKDSAMKSIYKYYKIEWDDSNPFYYCDNTADVKKHCTTGELAAYGRYYNSGVHKCYCIGAIKYTTALGGLKSAVVHSDVIVDVNTGSGWVSKSTTLPSGSKSLDFRNKGIDVYGIWNGYTVEQVCDTFIKRSPEKYFTFYQSGWKIGLTEFYDDYKDARNGFDTWRRTGNKDPTSINAIVNKMNAASMTARRQYNPSTGRLIGSMDTSGATAYYENKLKAPIQNPLWTFYIKADELGIEQPIPMARINYVTSKQFGSGERGRIEASVSNVGENGNVHVWATCNSPFSTSYSMERYITKNMQSIFVIEVDANVASKVSGTCKVCAKGAGQTGQDCKTVTVTANPQIICTANSHVCEGNLIKRCKPDGSGWETIKDCATDSKVCKYDGNGIPICLDPDEDPLEGGFNLMIFLQMLLIGMIIAAVLLVIAAVLVPPLRLVMFASPMIFIVVIVIFGFLIALIFSIPVGALAATFL